MRRLPEKFLALLLGFAINMSIAPLSTLAYFSDTETSDGVSFTAGILDIEADTESAALVLPDDGTAEFETDISDAGTVPFQYELSVQNGACSAAFFNALALEAEFEDGGFYSGNLSSFATTTATTTLGGYHFEFELDSGFTPSPAESCSFTLLFNAWQENISAYGAGGFTDSEAIAVTLTTGNAPSTIVLNEILPNPEGDDDQHGIQGEWVEIYNNGNEFKELAGWKITDAASHEIVISSANTLNGRTVIGPDGSYLQWIVVFMNDDIMNNGGDTVTLYDADGNLVDQYAYGSSTTDEDSDSHSTGGGDNENPAGDETAGNEGKSDARIPDGIGNWIDPVPTPGEPNKLDEASLALLDAFLKSLSVPDMLSASSTSSTSPETASSTPSVNTDRATSTSPTLSDETASSTASSTPEKTDDSDHGKGGGGSSQDSGYVPAAPTEMDTKPAETPPAETAPVQAPAEDAGSQPQETQNQDSGTSQESQADADPGEPAATSEAAKPAEPEKKDETETDNEDAKDTEDAKDAADEAGGSDAPDVSSDSGDSGNDNSSSTDESNA